MGHVCPYAAAEDTAEAATGFPLSGPVIIARDKLGILLRSFRLYNLFFLP